VAAVAAASTAAEGDELDTSPLSLSRLHSSSLEKTEQRQQHHSHKKFQLSTVLFLFAQFKSASSVISFLALLYTLR
jgi:hypothetical protein